MVKVFQHHIPLSALAELLADGIFCFLAVLLAAQGLSDLRLNFFCLGDLPAQLLLHAAGFALLMLAAAVGLVAGDWQKEVGVPNAPPTLMGPAPEQAAQAAAATKGPAIDLSDIDPLAPRYAEFIGKEIQTAYLESYSEYGQNIFDRYVTYADFWIQDQEYRDTDTGEIFDRVALNAELEKIEKPAGLSNPKDFRNEIVNFVLRARANNAGKNPLWTSYEKLRTVIEKKMFSNTEDLLPVISFNAKASADEQKKHEDFVNRMVEKGYTHRQVRLLCEWYLRVRKSS